MTSCNIYEMLYSIPYANVVFGFVLFCFIHALCLVIIIQWENMSSFLLKIALLNNIFSVVLLFCTAIKSKLKDQYTLAHLDCMAEKSVKIRMR